MKVYKYILLFFLIPFQTFSQDTAWVNKTFNGILTLKLPSEPVISRNSYVTSYSAGIHQDFFLLNYYDTAMNVGDEILYKISLNGFANGVLSQVPDSLYTKSVREMVLGGMKGIMFRLVAQDTSLELKQIYFFATMANDRFYLFQAASADTDPNRAAIARFFSNIQFDTAKIRESRYKLGKILSK